MRALGPVLAAVVERAARLTGRKIGLALMYHRIAAEQGDPVHELVPAMGADLFEEQMRHVGRHYRPVRAEDLPAAVASRRRGERFPVAVTFDDDDANHVPLTLPILARTGVKATFFLNCVGTRFWWQHLQDVWDRGIDPSDPIGLEPSAPPGDPRRLHELSEAIQQLPPERRAEAAAALAELAGPDDPALRMPPEHRGELERSGHELGWHTMSHEPLPTLDDASLATALREGAGVLPGAKTFAYPHGSVDARVADATRAAGFVAAYTVHAARVTPDTDPMLLGRLLPSFESHGHFALQLARRLVRSNG
jgi:peptidoglycan/xylan/chitin deacetylase (PgdA/CDA1 family)